MGVKSNLKKIYEGSEKMETFTKFMTDNKFLLPNWSWIAIALVVIAVIIIIACSVALGRKKKHARSAEENDVTAVEKTEPV